MYLGLVNRLEGGAVRIDAANRLGLTFGIATDCGLGRMPADKLPELLDLHVRLAGQD